MNPFETHYDPQPLREWAEKAPITTLPALMKASVDKWGDKDFLGAKEGQSFVHQTYAQVYQQARQFGAALVELGIEAKERVGLMSVNRPEWVITDVGVMQAAAINVPLYPTLSVEAAEFIINDSGSRVVVVNDAENAQKLVQVKCPKLEHIVCMCSTDGLEAKARIWGWQEFLDFGKEKLDQHSEELERRQREISPLDVCSLVYTSGTTGNPKGAMLMHGNFISNSTSVVAALPLEPGHVQLSFLPLSHVFERFVYYGLMSIGGVVRYAGGLDTLKDDIALARPHIMPSVPRLYEKIRAGILAKAEAGPAVKKALLETALTVGKKNFEGKLRGKPPKAVQLAYAMVHKVALKKIHDAMGGRLKILVSGGAPLRSDVAEFFLSAGFLLSEGYGLTETSPAICFNPLYKPKIGTVGTPVLDVEVKLGEDKEILARGPNIMLGYFNNPEATRAVIDDEGWFATGDIGEIDSEGYLRITDRKKEILVMSNGKNVAPQPVEQAIKASKYIEQAVLIGDNKKYISALLVPNFVALEPWLKERGIQGDPQALVKNEQLVSFLLEECGRMTGEFSNYERVKKVALLPVELTQESGELTPKMSVKRRVVNEKYAEEISSLYSSQE